MEENKKINNNDLEQVTGGANENALPIDDRKRMEELLKQEAKMKEDPQKKEIEMAKYPLKETKAAHKPFEEKAHIKVR